MFTKGFIVVLAAAAACALPQNLETLDSRLDLTAASDYAGKTHVFKCSLENRPTDPHMLAWMDRMGNWVAQGASSKMGSRFTVNLDESAKSYDLTISNLAESDGENWYRCGAYVYGANWVWLAKYDFKVYPASAEAEKDACYFFTTEQAGCSNYKKNFCKTSCAPAADCKKDGTVVCGDVPGADQITIVKKHNELRQRIANGEEKQGYACTEQPAGTNINELSWNGELATTARRWAEQEIWEHDCNSCRKSASFPTQGQNMAWTSNAAHGWNEMIQMWYDEVKDYNYAAHANRPTKVIGHYTAALWASTKLVGCGTFKTSKGCDWVGSQYAQYSGCQLYVCNYYPGGNMSGVRPYSLTEKCAKYSSTYNKLCA